MGILNSVALKAALSHPFPVIAGTATSTTSVASISLVVNLPANIQAGDLLLIFLSKNVTGGVPSATGWTFPVHAATSANGTIDIGWKLAAGNEGSSVTVSITGGSSSGAYLSCRVVKWRGTPQFASAASATTPSLDVGPFWSISPTLWITFYGATVSAQPTITIPTNYRDKLSSVLSTTLRADLGWRNRMWNLEVPDPFIEAGGTVTGHGTATVAIRGK